MISAINHQHTDPAAVLLSGCPGISLIDMNTVIRIQSSSNYSKLFFSNGKTIVVTKVLRWFEEKLPPQQFVRVHRSHLVNKRFIHEYINVPANKVILLNGEQIGIAKRKRSLICPTKTQRIRKLAVAN